MYWTSPAWSENIAVMRNELAPCADVANVAARTINAIASIFISKSVP
jgi:hypothetical protein